MRPTTPASFLCLVSACAPAGDRPAEPVSAPATITVQQFQDLRYLQGSWRGSAAGGEPFYETYLFVDDSTIRGYSYPDSTLAVAADSTTVELRGGRVASVNGPGTWVATAWDSGGVKFEPREGASNTYVWSQVSRDKWTARLLWTTEDGNPSERVYTMTRLAP